MVNMECCAPLHTHHTYLTILSRPRPIPNVLCGGGGGSAYLQGHRSTHHQTQQKRLPRSLEIVRITARSLDRPPRGSGPRCLPGQGSSVWQGSLFKPKPP